MTCAIGGCAGFSMRTICGPLPTIALPGTAPFICVGDIHVVDTAVQSNSITDPSKKFSPYAVTVAAMPGVSG